MVQKAEQHYNTDYQDTYGRSQDQNKWIWGALGALALLALVVWFASSGGPTMSPAPATNTNTEQTTAPAVPQVEEPAPAPAPAQQPAQPNQTQQ